MSIIKRTLAGCVIVPMLLVASCIGKMYVDARLYELPGKVLQSSAKPTRVLKSPLEVAEALDAYVQPRFEILRDKNFGVLRLVYREHAGVGQLKVDTPQEQELIANVNATGDDYAISLLHCAPNPRYGNYPVTPHLELLYYNQQRIISDEIHIPDMAARDAALKAGVDKEGMEQLAVAAMQELMAGKEHRAKDEEWSLLMRPVPAKQECLSCHTGAKSGAALGIMVYAVRKRQHEKTASLR